MKTRLALPEKNQTSIDKIQLQENNKKLISLSAQKRVAWAFENLPEQIVLTSSFGLQSAVCLHLITQVKPDVPVILIDTGYLFKETYQFIDELTDSLNLNLQVFNASLSAGWIESRYGRLWEAGVEGIKKYNQIVKVKPMEKALDSLNVKTWFSGIRQTQSKSRQNILPLNYLNNRFKFLPIFDWSNRDVHQYLKAFNLPYHPLYEKGYVSIGDNHSSRPIVTGMLEEETRFNGLVRECGLHGELL